MTLKRNRLIFGLLVAAAAVLMLTLNLLTPLLADDYMYAFSFATGERIASVGDIFPSLAEHAVSMNGRLVPHFFVQLFTLLPRSAFAVVNAGMYLLFTLGLYRLARSRSFDWKLLLIVQGGVFLLPPAFGQSFLWLAGSINYLWCDTLLVWLLVPFADAVFDRKSPPTIAVQTLMAVGALLFGNMSENVSAAGGVMMGLCIAWLLWRKRRAPVWMLVTLLATLVGWLALMLVPANRASVARSAGGVNALFTQFSAALDMWRAYGLWPTLGLIVLACALTKDGDRARIAFACGLALSSLLCNFAMTAADYYPERAFTGSAILLAAAYSVMLSAIPAASARSFLATAAAACLALVMLLEGVNAVPNAYNRYRQAQARVQEVCAARDAGETDVTTYGVKSRSRFDAFYRLNELTEDAEYFPNVYFAKYYGLRSVVVDRYE